VFDAFWSVELGEQGGATVIGRLSVRIVDYADLALRLALRDGVCHSPASLCNADTLNTCAPFQSGLTHCGRFPQFKVQNDLCSFQPALGFIRTIVKPADSADQPGTFGNV